MVVLAGMVLPKSAPHIPQQLQAAASVVAADLAYARSLAVTYASKYRVQFDVSNNRYWLEHSGANPKLDLLPASTFFEVRSGGKQLVVDLGRIPQLPDSVRLVAIQQGGVLFTGVARVEFAPLGQTTELVPTIIWLSAGGGPARRFIAVHLNPATGVATIGAISAIDPNLAAASIGAASPG